MAATSTGMVPSIKTANDMNNANIADHVLIGNCRAAALVSKYGSINWCCMPEFHSPATFAALLDNEKGGFFLIQPTGQFRSFQSYATGTNVAEVLFETDEGSVKLIDCFVAMEEHEKQAELFPDHEILRMVECISGSMRLRYEYVPRSFYGKYAVRLKDYKRLGIHFTYRENVFVFQTTVTEVNISDNTEKISGEFQISKDERVIFSMSCSTQYPAIIPEIKTTAAKRVEDTIGYWRNWINKCRYDGVFADWVLRSALTLKLLTHAPSGAIVAAPTTSLPESLGGVRNWDYRFCWLRDASFTVRALIKLGYYEEAHAYMSWILHATRLTQPKLQVVYNVFGNAGVNEKDCDWLKGYKHSRPVRIGNNAHRQFQLDVYGEVLDAVYAYSKIIDNFDRGTRKFIIGLGKTICKHWNEPDNGIWEIRSSAKQHTHSKVMAWVGLDRLIRLSEKYGWKDVPKDLFRQTKEKIGKAVEELGFNRDLNTYVSDFDGSAADAVLLTFPLVNYCSAGAPEMTGTVRHLRTILPEHGFMYRYLNSDDGLPGKEGAFIVANFWLIENLAKMGQTDEAIDLFNMTVASASPHGLLSEEIDPVTKEWLGNFPQGFSHIGLINAALSIDEAVSEKQKL
jgi:GH15 family glucan-1,4-alpha-glucosidase